MGGCSLRTNPISLIVAVAANGVIGHSVGGRGAMPWHLPRDLQHFKAITLGGSVIMGRKCYESIGRLLPGRQNIVITRQHRYRLPKGGVVVRSTEEAVHVASSAVFVIGGAQIYKQFLPITQSIYLTHIHASPQGDVHFDELGPEWALSSFIDVPKDSENEHDMSFRTYTRR